MVGLVILKDKVRDNAKLVIEHLHENNLEVVMLTGDNYQAAQNLATELGIKHFRAGVYRWVKLPKLKT